MKIYCIHRLVSLQIKRLCGLVCPSKQLWRRGCSVSYNLKPQVIAMPDFNSSFNLISCLAITPEYHFRLSIALCPCASERASQLVSGQCSTVCVQRGLQDNLLMCGRGLGLSMPSISIRQNCWLLLCTQPSFSSSGTHSKPLHTISHAFCSKKSYTLFHYTTNDFLGIP